LTDSELATLIETSGKRALPYMLAAYTGLRRGEIQKLTWEDLHLDETRPYILARASTTKNKKTAVLPLIPPLVTALKAWRAKHDQIASNSPVSTSSLRFIVLGDWTATHCGGAAAH
jgi:integrase